jgi:hypothetical protein
MADYIFLMHSDVQAPEEGWPDYLDKLSATGRFRGGSSIGPGVVRRRGLPPGSVTESLVGFIRVEADDLAGAEALLAGNPVYEAGGTVEIRLLPEEGA